MLYYESVENSLFSQKEKFYAQTLFSIKHLRNVPKPRFRDTLYCGPCFLLHYPWFFLLWRVWKPHLFNKALVGVLPSKNHFAFDSIGKQIVDKMGAQENLSWRVEKYFRIIIDNCADARDLRFKFMRIQEQDTYSTKK